MTKYPDDQWVSRVNNRHHDAAQWFYHPKRWVEHLPFEGIEAPAWMEHAACYRVDPDAYFKGGRGSYDENDEPDDALALRVLCRECPVRTQCLEYALDLQGTRPGSLPGMWAGTTERQRINLLKKRAAS